MFGALEMLSSTLLIFHLKGNHCYLLIVFSCLYLFFVMVLVLSILILASQHVFMCLGWVWWSPQKYCCEGHGEINCSLAQLAAAAEEGSPASIMTGCAGKNVWGRGEEPWGKGYKTRCCFFLLRLCFLTFHLPLLNVAASVYLRAWWGCTVTKETESCGGQLSWWKVWEDNGNWSENYGQVCSLVGI